VLTPPIIVSPVQQVSPHLGNAYLLARLGLSPPPTILALTVILIATVAKDPLSTNAHHALGVFLFSVLDVAYRHVAIIPSFSTRQLRHARIATQAARAAPVRGLINVWHVQTLPRSFCKLEYVNLRQHFYRDFLHQRKP
jgi:hypothetical protein